MATAKKNNNSKLKYVELTKLESKEKVQEKIGTKGNNHLTVLGIIILALIAILIFALTYAYFAATIKDMNPNKTDTKIVSANLEVEYLDGKSNINIGEVIEPNNDYIIQKDFSVKNNGNDTGMYTVVLENIDHNLGHKELVNEEEKFISDISYKLLKLDVKNEKEIETLVATGYLPFKSGENKDAFVVYTKDEVEVSKTNNYRLELTYLYYSNIDQSDSMGGKLSLKVNITEFEGEERTQSTEY